MSKQQTIKDGSKCIFDTRGLVYELAESLLIDEKIVEGYVGKTCTVDSLETYTELGDKDFEYYNVSFEDGFELEGISGYHLNLIV